MMAFLSFSGLPTELRRSGLALVGAAALVTPLAGCGLHKKPKPAAITLTPPPTLRQTPLYTSDMGGKAPNLPPLPGAEVPAAQPSPPATPEPRKAAPIPVRHAKPSSAKPAGESDTTAAKDEPATGGSDTPPAAPPAPPPTVASKAAAADSVASPIGQLTTGNTPDAGQSHHDAGDLIHSTQNGVNNLKRTLSADETKIVIQIHSFLQQAQKALDNGDNDGAYTLATKAHVLLDELTPASQ